MFAMACGFKAAHTSRSRTLSAMASNSSAWCCPHVANAQTMLATPCVVIDVLTSESSALTRKRKKRWSCSSLVQYSLSLRSVWWSGPRSTTHTSLVALYLLDHDGILPRASTRNASRGTGQSSLAFFWAA
jgi:hypothetical protein